MFLKVFLISLLPLLLISNISTSQVNNSIDPIRKDTITASQHIESTYENQHKPDDEFNIFLLAFAAAAVSFMFGFVMLGMAVFLLMILLLALFIITGIISTSILVGWINRSYTSGFKYFVMVTGSVCGLIAGAFCFGIICLLFNIEMNKNIIVTTGGITGLIGGLICSYAIFKIMQVIARRLKTKLNPESKKAIL